MVSTVAHKNDAVFMKNTGFHFLSPAWQSLVIPNVLWSQENNKYWIGRGSIRNGTTYDNLDDITLMFYITISEKVCTFK